MIRFVELTKETAKKSLGFVPFLDDTLSVGFHDFESTAELLAARKT